jgi:hypothetical protein
MSAPPPPWQPRYALTPATARGLMAIEAARAVVESTPLPPAVEAELRHRTRVRADRYRQSIGNDAARGSMTAHVCTAHAHADDKRDQGNHIEARLDRPGNEFPGSSIGMSLRDRGLFAVARSVMRPHDVPVPIGDIPMIEPGNSFPGRSGRRALMRRLSNRLLDSLHDSNCARASCTISVIRIVQQAAAQFRPYHAMLSFSWCRARSWGRSCHEPPTSGC